jgi:hypothetical protein
VIAVDTQWGANPLFGIAQNGSVHYLGEHEKEKESKPAEGGKAASDSMPSADVEGKTPAEKVESSR